MAKKKIVAKRIKKVDVKHNFEDIVSMSMFSFHNPEEDKQSEPQPHFKEKQIVQIIGEPGILYEVRTSKRIKDKFQYLLKKVDSIDTIKAFEDEIEYPAK